MSSIRLSPKYGLNPAIPVCFYCNEAKNEILLPGRMKDDMEAPHNVVWDRRPCDKCEDLMKQGVILVSVRDDTRHCRCLHCKHEWQWVVRISPHTPNLSGEETIHCPECSSKEVHAGPVQKEDLTNPYRTGGWVVVAERFIREAVQPADEMTRVLKGRFAYVQDSVWDHWGLPRSPEDLLTLKAREAEETAAVAEAKDEEET